MSFKSLVNKTIDRSVIADIPPNARQLIDGLRAQTEDPRLYDVLVLLNMQIEQLQLQIKAINDQISAASIGTSVADFASAASVNNYDLNGFDICRITPTGGINITGVVAGAQGDAKLIVNVAGGLNTVTLTHQDAASSAANRFLCNTGANILLTTNLSAIIWYDLTTSRWRAYIN